MARERQTGSWTEYSDARGIDTKYAEDRARALRELAEAEAGPKDTVFSPTEMRADTLGRHSEPDNPASRRVGGAGGAAILHPKSPREDEQFAAIHDRQDELLGKDPSPGATGDTDPAANAKSPR